MEAGVTNSNSQNACTHHESTKKNLTIIHLNIQSLRNKLQELQHLIQLLNSPDIICVSEHWLIEDELPLYALQGYNMVSSYCRNKGYGGAMIYTKPETKGITIPKINRLALDKDFEICCSYIRETNLLVTCCYRFPTGNIESYINLLNEALSTTKKCQKVIILGDFLVQSKESNELKQTILSYNLRDTITKPTRISKTSKYV